MHMLVLRLRQFESVSGPSACKLAHEIGWSIRRQLAIEFDVTVQIIRTV